MWRKISKFSEYKKNREKYRSLERQLEGIISDIKFYVLLPKSRLEFKCSDDIQNDTITDYLF